MAPLMAARGLRISWARPAAISPSAARRSRSFMCWYSLEFSITSAVRSATSIRAAISSEAKASGTRSSQQARNPTTRSPAVSGMARPARMTAMAARASCSRCRASAGAATSRGGAPGLAARSSAIRRSMFSSRMARCPPPPAASSARTVPGSRKGTGGGPRLSRRRKPGRSSASSQSEAWVTRRVSSSAVEHHRRQLGRVDDGRQPVAQRLQPPHQLVPLPEEGGHHPLLHLVPQRVEEREDDERGDQRVEVEELGAAPHPGDEAAVDGHQHQAERGDDRRSCPGTRAGRAAGGAGASATRRT